MSAGPVGAGPLRAKGDEARRMVMGGRFGARVVAAAGAACVLWTVACDDGDAASFSADAGQTLDMRVGVGPRVDATSRADATEAVDAFTAADATPGLDGTPQSDAGVGADASPRDAEPPGDPEVLVGAFQVSLVAPTPAADGRVEAPGYTTLVGRVADGPTPSLFVWELSAEEGACRLFEPRVPRCRESCGGSAACVEDDVCRAYPSAQDVGAVRVRGLRTDGGETDFTILPVANTYQWPHAPYPAFVEGDLLSVQTGGGRYAPFSLQVEGIAPLVVETQRFVLDARQAMPLAWVAAGSPDASEVTVQLDISHHGGTKGKIECAAPDAGALEIPADLLDRLVALGTAGFPTIIVSRRSVGSTVIGPGRVDLVVASRLERAVEIPGLVSCTDDAHCAPGQACQPSLFCQ